MSMGMRATSCLGLSMLLMVVGFAGTAAQGDDDLHRFAHAGAVFAREHGLFFGGEVQGGHALSSSVRL